MIAPLLVLAFVQFAGVGNFERSELMDQATIHLYVEDGGRFFRNAAYQEAADRVTSDSSTLRSRSRSAGAAEGSGPLARPLVEFFEHKRRIHYAAVLAPAATSVYVLLLLFGLYSGIRRTLP